jgi:WD40 repeat protein
MVQSKSTRPIPPLKTLGPRAWATAEAPGGGLVVLARDNEVVLRAADGSMRVLGPGRPLALSFAPGGRGLATAGPGAIVRLWNERGELLASASTPAAARAIAHTPDGSSILVLDAAGGITVLDPLTLAAVTSWSIEGPANSIACSPDGRMVAVSFGSWLSESGWVECWSIAERRKLISVPASVPVGASRFTADGKTLIIGGWDGTVAWRALPGGELVTSRQLPKQLVATAAFSPDAGTLPLEPPPELAPPPSPVLVPGVDWVQGTVPSPVQ